MASEGAAFKIGPGACLMSSVFMCLHIRTYPVPKIPGRNNWFPAGLLAVYPLSGCLQRK